MFNNIGSKIKALAKVKQSRKIGTSSNAEQE